MCTGACILYGISRVVIGENKTFLGGEAYLKQRGVEVVVLGNKECQELMGVFIKENPDIWYVDAAGHKQLQLKKSHRNEDIGVEERVYSKEMK
jgi:creatinine deaminase